MKKPVVQDSQVEIVRSGQFYTLLLGKQISLTWDKGTQLRVHISASYRVQMHSCPLDAKWSSFVAILKDVIGQTLFFLHCREGFAACAATLTGMSTMI